MRRRNRWNHTAAALLAGGLLLGPAVGRGQVVQTDEPMIVAVFLMESKGSPLKADEVVGLTDYLATKLGEDGQFQIIPRDELKKRIANVKNQSYDKRFDSAFQIEIGREMAAQYSISSTVMKLGSQCLVTAQVWDLRRAIQVRSASERTGCKPEKLIDSVELIAGKLEAAMTGRPMPKRPQPAAAAAQPAPAARPAPAPLAAPDPQPAVQTTPASAARGKYLALAKTRYTPDEVVEVRWHDTTGSRYDWVDVVPADTPDDEAGDRLQYLEGEDGAFRVGDLGPGTYHARIYLDYSEKGYQVADELTFEVVAPQPTGLGYTSEHLGLARKIFRAGEEIAIHWFNTKGDRYDWINVVPAGTPDDEAGSHYDYTTAPTGSFTVEGLEPGQYEARAYLDYNDKGYEVADRLPFTVR